GRDWRVCREYVSRARAVQRGRKTLTCADHEAANSFQRGEGRMSLVKVADPAIDFELFQQPPSPDSKRDLLLQAQLRTAAIKLTGDPAIGRCVERVVAI